MNLAPIEPCRNFGAVFWAILDSLFSPHPLHIDLARVQWTERELSRRNVEAGLEQAELSSVESIRCRERVKRRMIDGDREWIPPLYNTKRSYQAWRKKHPKQHSNILKLPKEQA